MVKTPEEWRDELVGCVSDRRSSRELFQRYYDGDHPIPEGPKKVREKFKALAKQARTNWTALIVEATVERMNIIGFRFSDTPEGKADDDAWAVWQASRLDAAAKLAVLDAAVLGSSFMLCWPSDDEPGATITPESGLHCYVEYEDGSLWNRAAGIKTWVDDGDIYATVYLPDGTYKWIARGKANPSGFTMIRGSDDRTRPEFKWEERRVDGEAWPMPGFGVVPLVEIRPRLNMDGDSRSELDGGILDIVDRINQTIFNRLIAGEYAAFKQKWATGLEIPEDEDGNPVEPFDVAMDRLWASESPETKFGEFTATDLANYIGAVEADVTHLAAITKTPPHYLLGALVNSSGDALTASETGLVAKVRDRMAYAGEDLEEVIRTAFALKGEDARAGDMACEVLWADPEKRSQGELVDALVKMASIGVPREVLWSKWGASPQQVQQWKDMATQDAILAAIAGAPPQPPPQPDPTAPSGQTTPPRALPRAR